MALVDHLVAACRWLALVHLQRWHRHHRLVLRTQLKRLPQDVFIADHAHVVVPFPFNSWPVRLVHGHFLHHVSDQLDRLVRRQLLSHHVLRALPHVHCALKHLTALSGELVALVLDLSQVGIDSAIVGEQVRQLVEFELHLGYLEVH